MGDGKMIGKMLREFMDDLCEKEDYASLRGCIVSLIRDDPTFAGGDYEEACKYLRDKGRIDGVFQSYEKVPGEPGDKDKSQWDEKYFLDRTFALGENFSRERLAHVKEVGEYVYRDKPTPGKEEAAKKAQAAQDKPGTSKNTTAPKKPGSPINLKKYLPILIALLLVIVVVVILVKKKA